MKNQTLKLFTISLIAFVIIIGVMLYFFSERFTSAWVPIDHGFGETVTLSPDDEKIVFPFYQSGDGALYIANVDGSDVHQLTYPRQSESHVRPRFSHDGKKLLFLSREKLGENLLQSLYIMNVDGTGLVKISDEEDKLITDAIFSKNDQEILYLVAEEYTNYAPGANKRPHRMDLYKMSVRGDNKIRLTEDDSYEKSELSSPLTETIVGFIDGLKQDTGVLGTELVVFDVEKETEVKRVQPKSDFETEDIYSAKFSPDGEIIAFSAATVNPRRKSQFIYELYKMNKSGDNVEVLTSFRTFITEPTFFHNEPRLLFIQDQSWNRGKPNFKLWAVDLDGENIRSITLQMPQFTGTAL
ncbi:MULTISPECIES: TolB family protein [Bacillus]|uniref:TolB family protein n=1 Tax=Bacillus TaxID=1386 RepID=UPI001596C6D8|nr:MULTISPECIES: PD40 domain-containing protein [Bacillus]